MEQSPAPIDLSKLDELIDIFGDREEVKDLFEEFFAELPSRLEALRQGVESGASDTINHAAHALKGSSASLGATHVEASARFLEESARANVLNEAPDYLGRLEAELEALRNWLASEGLLNG